ncbi:DUF6114 domain-containing protein [Actinomycetes bacterium KLBMP 9797]
MSATPQHGRVNVVFRAWRAFRRWRRARPFWGGLFTLLAGLEIFGTARVSFGGVTFQMGMSGFLVWLIPTILVTCGALMWFTPQQRMFYAIVGALTTVFSLVAVNLGGFFVGLLLGMVGTALGFAWVPRTPAPPPPPPADPPPSSEEEPPSREEALPREEPLSREEAVDDDPTVEDLLNGPPKRSPPFLVITLLLVGLAATGVAAGQWSGPAYAAPCPTPSASSSPTPSATSSPTPSASPSEDGGNIITDIVDGIGELLGAGATPALTPTPTLTPTPSAPARAEPAAATSPAPSATPSATSSAPEPCAPDPSGSPGPEETEEPENPDVKVIPPPDDVPPVNETPSRQTGSKLTMYGLRFDGVTELPTVDGGAMRVLQFSMAKAVTDNFELRPTIPDSKTMSLKSNPLTVEGHVRFFATSFKGKLGGLVPDESTPDKPSVLLIEKLELPIPVFYTDVEVQLAYVDCDKLTARELDNTIPTP